MAQFGVQRNAPNWVSQITAAVVSQPVLRDSAVVERTNLLNMAKLSIKGLIESALSFGRTLDSDYPPIQQFFVVMEHCLKHGLKVRKSFLSFNKTIWGPLEIVEKLCPEAEEIATSVRDLPGLRTPLGRARAWLRLAMMQKKLADYLRCLIMRRDLLSDFYENHAVMMEEEGTVIVGMLVGLNVIDANLCVKGEDLDSQVGVIDFSIYLKSEEDDLDRQGRNMQIAAILDQKNYVEELNRQLRYTGLHLFHTNQFIMHNSTNIRLAIKQSAEDKHTNQHSRHGLYDLYADSCTQHQEDSQTQHDVDIELEPARMQHEIELAVQLLEKDIQDKHDTLVGLKEQLEEVKAINGELYQKMQGAEDDKSSVTDALEDKSGYISAAVRSLDHSDQLVLNQTRSIGISYGKEVAVESTPQYKVIKDISF
ncbi:hypothetical protein XELAEV_18036996mg [Xenopus laevis]|uniref:RUN domain-containing protein n=1 Tax=Xenopus laevis TaxID=8355 RepID=A0A974CBR4_XENLA|nr:hypothetical protein XELAEV_18036996mg [Xenopus laevis]